MIILMLTACTDYSPKPVQSVDSPVAYRTPETGAWHSCRFNINWPEQTSPNVHVDLLLAHVVIHPVLRDYDKKLLFWRFHRRMVRDNTGHQFSFLFFTDASITDRIKNKIISMQRLEQLKENKIINQVDCDDIAHWSGPEVSDSSDQNWSQPVQKNWPYFIMGVSNLWLGLIQDVIGDAENKHTPINNLLNIYYKANLEITSIWKNEGQHAFLHHLNAVFGYESILVNY